jgi:hypothetical protein
MVWVVDLREGKVSVCGIKAGVHFVTSISAAYTIAAALATQ